MNRLLTLVASLLLVAVPAPASALVIQRAVTDSNVVFLVSDPFADNDGADLQGTTSAEITADIGAAISDSRSDPALGNVNYNAAAAVGRFGSVGLSMGLTGGISAGEEYTLTSQVAIYSDEFVNLGGIPGRVEANFIIDGGSMFMEAGNAEIRFQLDVQGENLGNVPIEAPERLILPRLSGAHFQAVGEFTADAVGNQVFVTRGQDIGAMQLDRNNIEIPLSFQSLDLGILGPGERMAIRYVFTFEGSLTGPGAFAEGIFADFSDPLSLGIDPSVTLSLTPVPEPTGALLIGVAIAVLFIGRRMQRR